jgi:O-antigen ligase
MHGTFADRTKPASWRGAVLALSLAGLIALGGGGSPAPLAELACELIAVVALIAWLAATPRIVGRLPAGLPAITMLALAVPLLQLVPLPPAIWQGLPGRENVVAALALAGAGEQWRPLSISPHRTLAALLSLGPPLMLLWFAALATARELRLLAIILAAMGLLAVVIGAGQLAQGSGGWLDFYATGDVGTLHGFNANRNTAADVFLVALLALALVWSLWPSARTRVSAIAFVDLGLVLLLAVFLTGSRTGIGLVPVALGFAGAILLRGTDRPFLAGRFDWKLPAILSGVGLALVAALWWWRTTPAIARVLARFDLAGEFRPELWRDAWFAAGQYWPLGSGLGTFLPAVLPYERLEVVDPTLPNRAHNELLELAIEGGLPLLACWLTIVAILGWRLRKALSGESPLARANAWFSAGVLAIAGLHSLVDYPLRSMAMASLVAMAAGIILSAGSHSFRAE